MDVLHSLCPGQGTVGQIHEHHGKNIGGRFQTFGPERRHFWNTSVVGVRRIAARVLSWTFYVSEGFMGGGVMISFIWNFYVLQGCRGGVMIPFIYVLQGCMGGGS